MHVVVVQFTAHTHTHTSQAMADEQSMNVDSETPVAVESKVDDAGVAAVDPMVEDEEGQEEDTCRYEGVDSLHA